MLSILPRYLRYNGVMALPILKEPPITSREAFIPYAMAALNMLAPTIAARSILSPQVLLVSIFLILMGIPCSVNFRQRQYHRIVLNLIITVPLLILTWVMVHTHPGLQFNWSDPMDSMLSHDSIEQLQGVLWVFTLLAAGRAFLLVTSADLLQTPLPGISIFLLAVITDNRMERDPVSYICLMVLFISSIYLFSQEQSQQWFSIHTPLRIQLRLIDWTLLFCLALFPLVFLAGWPLQHFNMSTMAAHANHGQFPRAFRLFNFGHTVSLGTAATIEMGGANWPNGKQTVMDVHLPKTAPQSLLWRGNTYSTYENGVWSNKDAPSVVQEDAGWQIEKNGTEDLLTIDDHGAAAACDPGIVEMRKEMAKPDLDRVLTTVTQTFDIRAPLIGDQAPVYGAFQTSAVAYHELLFNHLSVGCDGTVVINKVEPGAMLDSSYRVTSLIKALPTAFPNATRPLKKDPPLTRDERNCYLQMPGGPKSEFSTAIRKMAYTILSERALTRASSPFNLVNQIELYLGEHYRYTLTPKPPKNHADPIVDFLYTQQEGYCNYFAGSMVMLCRSIGLPARFVVGFATGDMDEKSSSEETVSYHVTAEQAHSWVEVYLPYYGWFTVDPTAGSRLAVTPLAQAWDDIVGFISAVKTGAVTWWSDIQKNTTTKWYTLFVIGYLLFVVLAVVYFRRDRPPDFPRGTLTPADAHACILQCYQRMHRWLDKWGVLKPEGLTAREFEQLFRVLNPIMGASVSELTDLYIRAQYTDEPLGDTEARRAITLLHQLWAQGRTERKHLVASEA